MAIQKTLGDVVPEIPEEVASAADAYLKFKRNIALLREKMNAALDALILRMHEADLTEILIDDQEKRLVLTSKELVQIKKRSKPDDADAEDD